ncbi:regulatory inactivation of DnaA Hda protein [Nitrosomonas sp. Nm51]|uniref:DnaA regulatory inactivator Hda n=1 Tax=Nitrosomonas sp. Nm51 TaxID=133720 RepID=UPI0008CA9481|nr:DnaA regulatory inactivator Hda [Nitrosomonas sp. Nm51]SER85083.1 regulatory inactivation of DnaA Hda protein [Nitrosomonas sp. Nm51]
MIGFSEEQLLLDIKLPVTPSLNNFVPGRNFELIQTLKKTLFFHEKERFFYIWGNSGCGKSHLLQAVVGFYLQSKDAAYYFPGEISQGVQLIDDPRCVAIDDVELLDDAAQVALFNIYNQFREDGNAILLVSGLFPPVQLNLRRDLVTRLGSGLVYQVHELTEEEKIKALQQQAIERGFVLKYAVCRYLLHHTQRDLSSLMMILDALDRFSLVHQCQITIPLLKKLLNGKL